MNYDLIAAGHPRLDFSFHAFLGVMPKHWPDIAAKPGSPAIQPGFKTDRETHAEAWAIGQVVAAEAALKLLADRGPTTTRFPMPVAGVFGIRLLRLPSSIGGQVSKPTPKAAERCSGPNRVGSLAGHAGIFPKSVS